MTSTDLPTAVNTDLSETHEAEAYLEQLPEAEGRGKKLFSRKHIMFTYKSWINKDELQDFMLAKMKIPINKEFPFWRAAHETGDTLNPYLHTHVLVDFGKAWQCTNSRFFDWIVDVDDPNSEVIHPNMKGIVSVKHFANAKAYLSKEDPANADLKPKIEANLITGIWNSSSRGEALMNYCEDIREATGILAVYEAKPSIKCELRVKDFRRWQLEIKAMCDQADIVRPDRPEDPGVPGHFDNGVWVRGVWNTPTYKFESGFDRKLNVVHEDVGATGKTTFGRQMMILDPVKYLCVNGLSQSRDMATVIQTAFASGWSGHTIFINLTRAAADHKIYDALECIRDGMMTSQKYRGQTMLWDMKNVWMFMNWMPKFTAVSLDRWQVWQIDKETKGLRSVPMAEAMSIWRDETEARHAIENPSVLS